MKEPRPKSESGSGGDPHAGAPVILIAANALKGTLEAGVVASAIEEAVRLGGGRPLTLVGSDGGDGLLEALRSARLIERETSWVVEGATGRPIRVPVGWLDPGTAVVESRMVTGPPQGWTGSPAQASTRGVGQILAAVGAEGASTVYVGLGGSVTMDGGLGMATALGWRALDTRGQSLPSRGEALGSLQRLLPPAGPPWVEGRRIVGLADVTNPLLGRDGARVFARQKGADEREEGRLAAGLERLVEVVGEPGARLAGLPGAGAAGGLGFGILYFAQGTLTPGAPWVLDRLGFDGMVARADAVVTAEGRFDATSGHGKLPGEVIARARKAGVPVGLLAPLAEGVPEDVPVESGGAIWDREALVDHARVLLRRLLRLPGR